MSEATTAAEKAKAERDARIKQRNAEFAAMSPDDKRVAIVRDVLRLLDEKRFTPTRGQWITPPRGATLITKADYENDVQVQAIFERKDTPVCEVCQIGAMCYAAISRFDDFTAVQGGNYGTNAALQFSGHLRSYLLRYFSEDQVKLIEYTFEGGKGAFKLSELPRETLLIQSVFLFRERVLDERGEMSKEEAMMRAICKRIIDGGGQFYPANP